MTRQPTAGDGEGEVDLAAAHARFARAVVAIYVATAAVAVVLFVASLLTDLGHQRDQARATLLLETQLGAHHLGRHLGLLAEEVRRLGLRSEVDLTDQDFGPERALLNQSHGQSPFFNRGVAILDADGRVAWSEPASFLPRGDLPVDPALLVQLRRAHGVQIVPASRSGPPSSSAVLYVASPVERAGRVEGVLLGAIDLATTGVVDLASGRKTAGLSLATRDGRLLCPPGSPLAREGSESSPLALLAGGDPFVRDSQLAGEATVVAAAPVQGTDVALLAAVPAGRLYEPSRRRFLARLLPGLAVAALPLVGLSVLLRDSLRTFRAAEERAVRGERLRSVGEAASLIAHEVRNALNGLRMGLDLALPGDPGRLEGRQGEALRGLRQEVERLTGFTADLLRFSQGIAPRAVPLDLSAFATKVGELFTPAAERLGVAFRTVPAEAPLDVLADPTLVHAVIANLVGNAIDFAAAGGAPSPTVEMQLQARQGRAEMRVSDNGHGVAEGVRPRLFEPFVTSKPSGVGLGLALSRRIARAHGGDLELERSAVGAVFVVTLPLRTPAAGGGAA